MCIRDRYMAQTILHTEISHGRALAVRLHIHVCAELGVYVKMCIRDRL